MAEWKVTVTFKDDPEPSEYIFDGNQAMAKTDAYLSFPQGSIRNVSVTPYDRDE